MPSGRKRTTWRENPGGLVAFTLRTGRCNGSVRGMSPLNCVKDEPRSSDGWRSGLLKSPASSVPVGDATPTIDTPRLFQAKLAIVLPDNSITLAGGVFKFLAVHNLHCATGILDELLLLQNTSCRAHGRSIRS